MILITHDLGVVAEMADKVAVMYGGRIVEAGSVEQIFTDPQHPYTIGLMSSMPSLGARSARLVTVPGTVPQAAAMPPGCRFSTRCPFATDACARVPVLTDMGADHRVACFHAPLEADMTPQMKGTGT